MWLIITGDVVANYGECGGELPEMWWLSTFYVVANYEDLVDNYGYEVDNYRGCGG